MLNCRGFGVLVGRFGKGFGICYTRVDGIRMLGVF